MQVCSIKINTKSPSLQMQCHDKLTRQSMSSSRITLSNDTVSGALLQVNKTHLM